MTIVNANGVVGETFCIHAGTYELGELSLTPLAGQSFVGDPVTRGPNGEVYAPTVIEGGSPDGVFEFTRPANGVLFENLDVSGSPGTKDPLLDATKKQGRGINGNSYAPVITIRTSRIHHNSNAGVGGIGPGTLLEYVELDHNGSDSYLGCCAGGVKSGNYFEIRDSYVHDNTGYGIWCDVDCTGGVWHIHDNLVTGNTHDGIRFEISMNPYGARIEDNVVQGNNTSGKIGGHGGIAIVSSWNAVVADNVLGNNETAGIEFRADDRGTLAGNVARRNVLNGDILKGCDLTAVACDP